MAAPWWSNMKLLRFDIIKRCSFGNRFCSTTKRTVKELLSDTSELEGVRISAVGWLKSCRKQKKYTFFHLNDGTSTNSIQVVAESLPCVRDLSVGCSVKVVGDLVKSPGKGQMYELIANNVELLGKCDNDLYPLEQKSSQHAEYLRQYLHLRPRTEQFNKLLRVRNTATMAVHKYFQNQDYIYIHTPIITSSDCEGAGEVFHVKTRGSSQSAYLYDNVTQTKDEEFFFDHPTFLTVSGQLHLEAMTSAFRKVYTFGPTFRAENSVGRHHLAEFNMIEAEIAFTDGIETIVDEMETLVKSTCKDVVDQHEEIVSQFWQASNINDLSTICRNLIEKDYIRMSYSDAVKELEHNNDNFQFRIKWGDDLQKEHERYLVKFCDNTPIFVTDYPADIKPFYARRNDDDNTVSAVDLLVPEVGELFGGSIREERLDIIKARLDGLGMTQSYQWYLDLRRYGSAPHGGFGMGFERLLQCFLGVNNIKDTLPFPRWPHNCLM